MLCMLAELFYNKQFLRQLERTPGMTWKAGIPKRFETMTKSDVRSMLSSITEHAPSQKVRYVVNAPEAFDWSLSKPECSGPTTVRDQGACGSCWAFSSVDQLADNRCIVGMDNKRVQYSEQYVVSCDPIDMGCNGGWLGVVQNYLVKTGTTTDKCVPYTSGATGITGTCPTKCEDGTQILLTHASATSDVCTGVESMKAALTVGTLQFAFTVYSDFMYYSGGIYQHKTGFVEGGHAVMGVGYGEEDGVPFWNVKNSWGPDWGESGYFRIIRGKNDCGIEDSCYLLNA